MEDDDSVQEQPNGQDDDDNVDGYMEITGVSVEDDVSEENNDDPRNNVEDMQPIVEDQYQEPDVNEDQTINEPPGEAISNYAEIAGEFEIVGVPMVVAGAAYQPPIQLQTRSGRVPNARYRLQLANEGYEFNMLGEKFQ